MAPPVELSQIVRPDDGLQIPHKPGFAAGVAFRRCEVRSVKGQVWGQLAEAQFRMTRFFSYLRAYFDPHPSHYIRLRSALPDCAPSRPVLLKHLELPVNLRKDLVTLGYPAP